MPQLVATVRDDDVIAALVKDTAADVTVFYLDAGNNTSNGAATRFDSNPDIFVAGVNVDSSNNDVADTFAHELGHILGGGHDELNNASGDSTDAGIFPDSRGTRENNASTIMFTPRITSQSSNTFSSAEQAQIGDDDHENDRAIEFTRDFVANKGQLVLQQVDSPDFMDLTVTECVTNQYQTIFAVWPDSPRPFTHYETAFSSTPSFNFVKNVQIDNADKFNLSSGKWYIGVRALLGSSPSPWLTKTITVNTNCGSQEKPKG